MVGCYINLDGSSRTPADDATVKDEAPDSKRVRRLEQEPKQESSADAATTESPAVDKAGSEAESDVTSQHAPGYVIFFVNGRSQGVAYAGIPLGKKYYPFISLYNGGEVVLQ